MAPVGKKQKWRQSRCTTKDNREWSQLPTLFIWMVKDCLNLSDNARLSSVCRNWNSTSRDYKPKPRDHPALPWIIHMVPQTTYYELINFSTMEKIVLNKPEFQFNPQILFSRRGWLLLRYFDQPSLLLFNLLTNVKIKIEVPKHFVNCKTLASFSLMDDDLNPNPHHLVFVNFEGTGLTLCMVNVATKICTKHSYEIGRSCIYGVSVRVVNNHVFILDTSGTTYIFDMSSAKWTEIAPLDGSYSRCREIVRMTETQLGEILQIVADCKRHSFRIFKLDDNKTGWEEMHEVDMNWFMSCSGSNNFDLVAKQLSSRQKKAYQLDHRKSYMDIGGNRGSIVKQTVFVHDIGDKSIRRDEENHCSFVMDDIYFDITFGEVSTHVEEVEEEKLYVEWFECGQTYPCTNTNFVNNTHWIDLGYIDKVPSTCIGIKIPPCTHS